MASRKKKVSAKASAEVFANDAERTKADILGAVRATGGRMHAHGG